MNTEKNRDRLIALLTELFQLDQPDLDFGFYRIMHAKSGQVLDFLQNDLPKIIKDAFGEADEAKIEEARRKYEQAIEQAKIFGISVPEETPPVKDARAAIEAAQSSSVDEGDVYEHLYRFFARYYDNGDFMSRRYFARETGGKAAPYAVPYDGREVYLHWANRDQYYIKTSEYFTNFTFDPTQAPEYREAHGKLLEDKALKVHCRIVAASEGEHNNVKAAERYFIIHNGEPIKLETADNGERELIIQFTYQADPQKQGQEGAWRKKRLEEAAERIKAALGEHKQAADYFAALMTPAPTEKDKNRTLLEKYIGKYAARNTMDYFIHKDLGSFLRRELDFYIKNEMMHLDDIEAADAPRVELFLSKLKVLRKIARYLIDILAQLENFQKKLWLKKKFVTETQYCITLDRIPENFYAEIAANAAQRKEWVKLFAIDELGGYSEPLREDFLKANPFLVLDTAFFAEEWKDALLASMPGIDENLDGLLIHSENFQALGLMQEKYREQIKCAHIDPPYNTQTNGFAYKNGYKHSSWLSMMENRVAYALSLLNDTGSIQCHIDENEYEYLHLLLGTLSLNDAGTVAWDKRNPMNGGSGVATQHEYIAWRTKGTGPLYNRNKSILSILSKARNLIENEGGVTEKVKKDFSEWVSKNQSLTGGEKAYRYIDDNGKVYRSVSLRAPERREDKKFHQPLIHPITNKPCAVPPNGFSRTPETLQKMIAQGHILFGNDETTQPNQKKFLTSDTKRQFSSVIQDAKKGKADIDPMKIEFPYCHPISLYQDMIGAVSHAYKDIILDYFAGSGTTGHAVVNLNREDGGQRKYIMVEMGHYFDAVTKPRMQKVVYSQGWKDGKPVSRDGISHAFKYIRLESYEDTLNNLVLQDAPPQGEARFQRDYFLHYWLDFETRGSPSLLNIENFADPTAYKLKVKAPGTDEYVEKAVDLMETFNWLIGLHVEHLGGWHGYDAAFTREPDPELPQDTDTRLILDGPLEETSSGAWCFRKVQGYTKTEDRRERTLVIWRKLTGNLEEDNLMLDEWFKKSVSATGLEMIYVNGSHNLLNLRQPEQTWQVRLIEEHFHRAMWEG